MSAGKKNTTLTSLIKERSASQGFDLIGIAKPRTLHEYENHLRRWVESGMNDKMHYLERDMEKRADPSSQFRGVRSVLVTALNYYAVSGQTQPGVPVLSRYTYGRDYHVVIKEKLETLYRFVKEHVPGAEGRIFVDSAPLLEKPWAVEAGLGWQGRHSIVINREIGSFFFIGILALDIELDYDEPYRQNHCGNCTICIDRCPTGAINGDGTIDARKCISNLTIENRAPLPDDLIPLIGKRVYGCDLCQEVCPWNAKAKPNNHPELRLKEETASMTRDDWAGLTKEKFTELFSDTPVGRVGFARFRSNIGKILGDNH